MQQMRFKNSFMWQYDPHGVINKLRIRVKLGPFIHHSRPEIGRFSNQSEWSEKTLIDMDRIVVDVENTLINEERHIDESSFLQVPEQGEQMNIPPILPAPANEERNQKRNKEEGSSSAMETTDKKFNINYRMRPKMNPVTEQEDTIESAEIIDTDTMVERSKGTITSRETQQPSTSNTQLIERQFSVELSSFTRLVDKEKDIKDRYKEINLRNEKLKDKTSVQYFKHTLANQSRLMSAFDIKKGKMQVSFMQPTV